MNNILKVFSLATPDEIADGIKWYAEAQAISKKLSLKHDMPLHIVVGVMAALSPNNKWERNVQNTDELIAAYLNGEAIESIKVSTYNKMKEKAWSILDAMPDHDQTISILNGQKIVSFYRNIMGDDTCTVDGHAYNIWRYERHGLTTDKTNIGKKLYTQIQEAYVDAANATLVNGRKLKAFEMQAITWVTWKRIHNI